MTTVESAPSPRSLHDVGAGDGVRPEGLARLSVSPKTWKWFLVYEAVVALIYFPFGIPSGSPRILGAVPWMEWTGQVPAWSLLGLSAVGAVVVGVRTYRPRAPLAWWLIGSGVLLFITGDTIYKTWHQIIGNQNIPFPSFIDAIYITMYPVLAVGILLLARSRVPGGDRASLLDALIVTLGVGLLSWIFLIGPNVRAQGGLLVRLTSAAYPLGDILLLAMLAHLWSAGGLRNMAGRLLAIGTVGTLVADSVYGLAGLHPGWNWQDGNPFDLGWVAFYSCWGAAALHPSMRELSEPRRVATPRTSPARLMLLGAVSLIAPVVLLVETTAGKVVDASASAGVAGVMFLLVVLRMSGLVRAHQDAVSREQVLRRESGELVGAPGRAEIHDATIKAVGELIRDRDVRSIVLAESRAFDHFTVVASSGVDSWGPAIDLRVFPDHLRESIADGRVARCSSRDLGLRSDAADPETYVFVCPVCTSGETKGVLIVSSDQELSVEISNAIEILSTQVGMALDRESMTKAFHARQSEARFQTLVQNASDVILIARPDTTIVYQTPSVKRILGYEAGELEGVRLASLLHENEADKALTGYGGIALQANTSATFEWRIRHADRSWRHVEVVANNLLDDPTVEGVVLTMRDVTERKGLEDELKHQAFHDALTGLANRALFWDRLEHALTRSARSLTSLAVLFIDLDDFKLINDTMGHGAGDELLMAVAGRLTGALRAGDTGARFGGDEFAVLLEETEDPEDACLLAQRLLDDLKPAFDVSGRSVRCHASIGIAYSKTGTEDPAELLQAADVAMYAAKSRGKNCYEMYEPALQVAVSQRLERSAELQRAVDENEFVLHYQPIVRLDGGAEVGVEALIRWNHPEHGQLNPKDFIPLAEETGLIIPIGRWVLGKACQAAKIWEERYSLSGRLKMSVNISARHFQHEGLIADVSEALRASGLDPGCLVLEITETLLVNDVESVIARMLELNDLGVGFAIDDFGTGYSSLSYLRRFPINVLKVDKSFVDDVGDSDRAAALAKAIVELGESLELDTVAEGIEKASQVDGLIALGCRSGQGFFFARPVPAEDMDGVLAQMAAGIIPEEAVAETEEAKE